MAQTERREDHNLVNRISRKPFSLKPLVPALFEVLSIAGAFGFGYGLRLVLEGSLRLFPLFLVLGFYLVVSALLSILVRNFSRRLSIAALEAAVVIVPFLGRPLFTLLVIAIIYWGFLTWGIELSHRELKNHVRIKFIKIIRHQFTKMVTGLTFVALLLYLPQWNAKTVFFSEKSVEKTFIPVSELVTRFYPELQFHPSSTLQTVAESIALSQLQNNSIFRELPESAKRAALEQATTEFIATLKKSFGGNISEQDPLSRAFYKGIIVRLGDWKNKFGSSFLLVWAIIMFFLIRGLGAVVAFVSLGVAYLVYQLLFVIKVLKLGEEQRTIETIELA